MDTAFMGLTSCRRVTINETLHTGGANAQSAVADCRAAVERAADHYTLICAGPLQRAAPQPGSRDRRRAGRGCGAGWCGWWGKQKEPPIGWLFLNGVRRRPTLPHSLPCSTIGAEGLSFRVRNGTGRFPFAMTAVTLWRYHLAVRDRISRTAQWTRSTL